MKMRILIILAMVLAAVSLAGQPLTTEESAQPMEIRFEDREPFILMGLEAQNAMESEAMMEVWTKFFALKEKLPEPVGDYIYAIYYPGEKFDPATMQGYNYLVGMEVLDPVELPEALQLHKVPGGHYAVFEYVGDINEIGKAYEYIYGEWMAGGDYKPSLNEMFERYDERFQYDSPKSVTEIWIPVQKASLTTEEEAAAEKLPEE